MTDGRSKDAGLEGDQDHQDSGMPWQTGRHRLDSAPKRDFGSANLTRCRLSQHRWDSAPPGLCADVAWSLQRLDSQPPPGVGAAWQHNWDSAPPGLCANVAWSLQRLDSAPPPGIDAAWQHSWDSAPPGLCAAAWSLQRLDSAPPPGVDAAWTWRCLSQPQRRLHLQVGEVNNG